MTRDEMIAKRLDYKVVKDNALIQSNTFIHKAYASLTSTQQILIAYTISLIKPNETELKKQEIRVADFCEVCGIDKTYFYTEFQEIIDDLDEQAFWIHTDKRVFKFRWFSEAEYVHKQGKIRVLLHSSLSPYLLEIKRKFTEYPLINLLPLRSTKYAVIMYELLRSYAYKHIQDIPLDELRELIGIDEGKYKEYKELNKFVLKRCIEKINTYTDINVKYEKITQGKKVIAIRFIISRVKDSTNVINAINFLDNRNKQIKGQMSIYDYDTLEV